MDEELQNLEREYNPPLDPALIHALYHDFLGNPDRIQLARNLLDGLKQAAIQEQLTDFDPSGSSGDGFHISPGKQGSEVGSNAESRVSETTITDYTSVSDVFSNSQLSPGSSSERSFHGEYFKEAEDLDTTTKERQLLEMFQTLRPALVRYTLNKCEDDYERATDELLNHAFFNDINSSPGEGPVVAKGIDGFTEDHHVPQRGKGKGKKKKRASQSIAQALSESNLDPVSSNKWADSNRDIDFIATRTEFSTATVASIYHKNGASLQATILAILRKTIKDQESTEPDPETASNAIDLVSEFSNIDPDLAIALIRVTAPSRDSAYELAKALAGPPGVTRKPESSIVVTPRYAPLRLSDPTPTSPKTPALPPAARSHTTASLVAVRSKAFNQASEAFRRGRSDPLYKAVAGYYAQAGRDANENLKEMNETEADELVSAQSSATQLDLHGVSVNSATRIAKERVRAWWDGLGEQRIPGGGRKGVGDGYQIITGLGRHSEGRKGKIGPAVVKALVSEGWKIELGNGDLHVVGKHR